MLAQRLHLLSLGRIVLNKLTKLQRENVNSPVYFLGERLPSIEDWHKKLDTTSFSHDPDTREEPFNLSNLAEIQSLDTPYASVICSMYRTDPHIDEFLELLTKQSIFSTIEIIIVLVEPTEHERSAVAAFQSQHQNVLSVVHETRIGIYAAWNQAIRLSSGKFLTNMNVDDIRHFQSLEIQVRELLMHPDIDVVFQDVFYSYSHLANWKQLEYMAIQSNLPPATLKNLAQGLNSPHNAPMWRRSLHERIGFFDESFASAGDHDFWIRCAIESARFRKSEFCHVGYFINPNGMSTKHDSPGRIEGVSILNKYSKFA